ncbi:preprotein translocase subunit YajC [uncultured Veillonella sp.]|uniref:preprotein translocase subunit YajC n=1 Tax=uncultured Veillonella sp. TaxID=159268 RepID=UPI0025E53081|nr:preprotein translocase subunit YajC [uncultured Veillonella sp.]MDY3974671.1 preprotein translocase subunit YajC [Veillonella caviae]
MGDVSQLFQAGWPILLMVVIFYFLLYRPQKKQQKARNELLNNLKRGQKIVTIGGIYGTINELHEDYVMLQVAEKVEMKFARTSIATVLGKDDK